MPSFIGFVLPYYVVGFLAFAFVRRWWLLLSLGAAAAVLGVREHKSALAADGPGGALGLAILLFLLIGAGSGFVASAAILIGKRSRLLRAAVVLPITLAIGFSGFFVFAAVKEHVRQARLAPPLAGCLGARHAAVLGRIRLSLPLAPNLFLESPDASQGHYMFTIYGYDLAREFCSDVQTSPPILTSVSISLDGVPTRREKEARRHPFCQRKQDLLWGYLTCNPITVSSISDMPMRLRASLVRPGVVSSHPHESPCSSFLWQRLLQA